MGRHCVLVAAFPVLSDRRLALVRNVAFQQLVDPDFCPPDDLLFIPTSDNLLFGTEFRKIWAGRKNFDPPLCGAFDELKPIRSIFDISDVNFWTRHRPSLFAIIEDLAEKDAPSFGEGAYDQSVQDEPGSAEDPAPVGAGI
jgi:hypothetical protein